MPTSFSRSLRSLDADSFRGSLVGIAVGLSLLTAWLAWFFLARVALYEVADAARLEVDNEPHEIMSVVTGRVLRNEMRLGRDVASGELLIELDASESRYELNETIADIRGHSNQLERLRSEISAQTQALDSSARASSSAFAEARARHQEALESSRFAKQEADRQSSLHEQGLLAKAEADAAATAHLQRVQGAQALASSVERMEREWQVELAERRAELESLERELSQLESRSESLGAVKDGLEHNLSLHRLRAPVAGRIGDLVTLKASEVVTAGQHLGTIIPAGDIRVVAAFAPHRALGRIKPGQPAKLRLDGFSWVQYGSVRATVSRVGSEPSGGTVRVELSLDEPDAFPVELGHGLPGTLEVEVEQISPAALVLRTAGNTLSNGARSGSP